MDTKIGKQCEKCGGFEREVKTGKCIVCKKEYARIYREKNKERIQEGVRNCWKKNKEKYKVAKKKWRENNKEKRTIASREWQRNNKDKVKERNKKWKTNNKDKVNKAEKNRRLKNPEKFKEADRKWSKNNPEKTRIKNQRRRAKLANSYGAYTQNEWKNLCNLYDNRCLACGKKNNLTVDHVIPLDLGGANTIDNIQPLCKPCNSSKCNKHIDYRTKPLMERWVQNSFFD
jgi:5-methylcytosine-specific restriction endonuclease McrA